MCKKTVADSLKTLHRHLKLVHGIHERHDRYICIQSGCHSTFGDKYAFNNHMTVYHSYCLKSCNEQSLDCSQIIENNAPVDTGNLNDSLDPDDEQPDINVIKIKDLACKFICQLKGKLSTFQNVHDMVAMSTEFFQLLFGDVFDDVKSLRAKYTKPSNSDKNNHDWDNLETKLRQYMNPFDGLETEYNQTTYLKTAGFLVEPTEYVIGWQPSYVSDSKTGATKFTNTELTGQHISIQQTLNMLASKTDILSELSKPISENTHLLTCYCNGSQWKATELSGQNIILLRLYGDDVEPANPLGSHKTLYKIGLIYYQFEQLPSYLQSKLSNIYLALCYHTEDLKSYGWRSVLAPLINELRELETTGIDLMVNGIRTNYKVILSCVTGDNLFLNSILGFVESFTAHYPCRHCLLQRCEFSNAFIENSNLVRTKLSYDAAVASGDVQCTGIKSSCELNALNYFHAAENYVQDIMHDFLEGICKYDMVLVCKYLVDNGYFTLQTLNNRIQCINYGYHDVGNKPPIITTLDTTTLPFHANEMWNFVLHFPVSVGQFIDESLDVWRWYLYLRQIMDIVFAPTVLIFEIPLLKTLISEYLELRVILFPDNPLKNKHHHILHYPRLIMQSGPLVRLWCMRFEQKHQRYKKLLHIGGNFKNIPYTVANRHQQDLACTLLCKSKQFIKCGAGDLIELSDNVKYLIEREVNSNTHSKWYHVKSVEIHGTKYKPGCYLMTKDASKELPAFVLLIDIFVDYKLNSVKFYCETLLTIGFMTHWHGWAVEFQIAKTYVIVDPVTLDYFIPMSLHSVCKDNDCLQLLIPRYHC